MRVTVCFGQTRVIVPCKGGATVAELVKEACSRYKKAIGKGPKYWIKIRQLENAIDGGILDADDYVYDVAEDRDQLIAIFEEEDDQTYGYSGWDHVSGSGSEGHRSPLSFQHHQGLNNRYSDEKSAGSNSSITVREPMVNKNRNAGLKKSSSGSYNYYGRRESGSGQEEDPHLTDRGSNYREMMIAAADSSPDQNVSVVTASSDTNISIDSGHHSIKTKYPLDGGKNYGNFTRGSTRQSIMGMLSETYEEEGGYTSTRQPPDGGKPVDFDDHGRSYPAEQYLQPPPKDASIYPWFYNDSQEMFVDIDNRPLGIKVTSYKENRVFLGLLVESVDKGGRSEREGLLQEGDVVVEINNYVLAQYSLSVAQEIFKDSMKFPELQLRVYPIEERERAQSAGNATEERNNARNRHRHTPSIPILSVVEATPPKANKISAAKSLPDLNASLNEDENVSPVGKLPLVARMSLDTLSNNTRKIGNMFEIELKKGEQGLGFSITTRDTPVGDPGPIYIKNILPKGAAIQDGRLRAGDRLLKVNDIEMTGHTQESAVNILRCIEVGSPIKLVVSRHVQTLPRKLKDDPAADQALNDESNKEYFKFEIALNDTGSAGLGISLKGNQSKKTKKDLGIFVKSVFHGGAAHQDGRLQQNDQLVSVNGQSLIGMTNHEAIDTLRTSMSTVGNVRGMIQMVVARRKTRSTTDPMSPHFSSEASSEISDSLVNERHSRTSLEITAEDSFRHNEEIPRQIDPNPMHGNGTFDDNYNDGDWTPSPDPDDPNMDPFSRESAFRQSVSEKRKGPGSRDAQSTDTFRALKNKQFSTEIADKKPVTSESKQSTPVSTPLKWVKPAHSKTNHSTNSTPATQTPTSPTTQRPEPAKRNLNNSSNLPANNLEQQPSRFDVRRPHTALSFDDNRSTTLSILSQASSMPMYIPPKPKLRRQLPKPIEPPSYSFNHDTPKSSKLPAGASSSSDSDSAPLPVVRKSNSSDSLMAFGLYSKQPSAVPHLKPAFSPSKNPANRGVPYLKPPARLDKNETSQTEVEVGPTLGIAKSSSLESLQTAVENYMDMQEGPFPKPQPRVLRGRVLNESFRAALDQSYDLDNLSGRPMATVREEGDSRNGVSPLAKSTNGTGTPRTHEKKRAGKSYKIFGIFRVGKNKRSLSSDRNSNSSASSSSPRIPESKVHKKLLEANREDDFKKHQAETERIQAKAKAMRERQHEQRKNDGEHYKSREDLVNPEDRVRAPSVPVTAMQRINLDPKVSYSQVPSGRRSVDVIAMRNAQNYQPSTFEWQTAKRPTSPVDYTDRNRHSRPERKSSGNKSKINPDYSSLPRQPRLEPNARKLPDNPDGVVTNREAQRGPATSPNHGLHSHGRHSAPTGNIFNNQEFYNMQKPPGTKKQSVEPKSQTRTHEVSGQAQRQGRSDKPKAGRTLYYDDTDDSVSPGSSRSKTPQPQPRARRDVSPNVKNRPVSTHNGFGFPISGNFYREDSPEPPPVVLRNPHQKSSTPGSTSYRHSVHVDAPASRRTRNDHRRQPNTARSRSDKQPESPDFRWKTHIQRHGHDRSDSGDSHRTTSPTSSSSNAERNRNAVKKILHQSRYNEQHGAENIVISPPYNL